MKLFSPDVSDIDGFYQKGKFTLVWRLSLMFLFAFIIMFIATISSSYAENIV